QFPKLPSTIPDHCHLPKEWCTLLHLHIDIWHFSISHTQIPNPRSKQFVSSNPKRRGSIGHPCIRPGEGDTIHHTPCTDHQMYLPASQAQLHTRCKCRLYW